MGATLLHDGRVSTVVTRADLYRMQTPARTRSWVPIPHGRLIDTLQQVLLAKGMAINHEEYAVMSHENVLFGVMDLNWETAGRNAALGIRTSNNKTFCLQLAIGSKVLVCDNLMLSGELIALKRKHTSGLDLREECSAGIDRYIAGYQTLEAGIVRLQHTVVSIEYAKAFVYTMFAKRIIPVRLFPDVARQLSEPNHMTLWDLNNHLTAAMKNLAPSVAFEAGTKLGKLFHLDHSQCVAVPTHLSEEDRAMIGGEFYQIA